MEQHIPGIVLKDGLTQPVFDYKRCLFEKVYVETPVDTDGDGRLDLIAVYIRRPLETTQGMRVPAIYVANPYMLECNEDWYVPHDVDRDVSPYPQQHITESEITFDPSTVSFPQPRYPQGHRRLCGYRANGGDPVGLHQRLVQLLQLPWLRLRVLRRPGYPGIPGIQLLRFPGGDGGIQGGHRLAQRPLPGLYQPDGQH